MRLGSSEGGPGAGVHAGGHATDGDSGRDGGCGKRRRIYIKSEGASYGTKNFMAVRYLPPSPRIWLCGRRLERWSLFGMRSLKQTLIPRGGRGVSSRLHRARRTWRTWARQYLHLLCDVRTALVPLPPAKL